MQIDGRNMHKLFDLFLKYFIQPGMAMPNINRRDSPRKIQILSSSIIVQILHVAPHGKKWFFIVWFVEGEEMGLVEVPGLSSGHALVRLGLVGVVGGGKPE